jgi:hypothetical protein
VVSESGGPAQAAATENSIGLFFAGGLGVDKDACLAL